MNRIIVAVIAAVLGSGCVHTGFAENSEPVTTELQCSCIPDNRNGISEALGNPPCWVKQMAFYPPMFRIQLGLHIIQTRNEIDQKKFFCGGGRQSIIFPRDNIWRYDYGLERGLMVGGNVQRRVDNLDRFITLRGKAIFCGKRIDRLERAKLIAFANGFGGVQSPGDYRFKK